MTVEPATFTDLSVDGMAPVPAGVARGAAWPDEPTDEPTDREGAGRPAPPRLLPVPVDPVVRSIEAVLMVAADPVPVTALADLLDTTPDQARSMCSQLARSYEAEGRGFVLVEVAGGWRLQSHPEAAELVARFLSEPQRTKLSAAALETLAVVAYKQPVSRAQVSAVRGVDADGVLRSLCQKGLVAAVGRDPGPGQALLYGTTTAFLEYLGLPSLADLPPLGDFVPGPDLVETLEEGLRIRRLQID